MTTIAYDGSTIAADRQQTFINTPVPVAKPKLQRITYEREPAVAAASGTIESYIPVMAWLRNRKKPRPEPRPAGAEIDFSILIVTKSGRVLYTDTGINFVELPKHQPWAIGSGCDYALGAMMAGANAHDAVLIASKLDIGTGMGIDVEDFQH